MTVMPSFSDDLWRVQLAISGFPNGTARVERSANEIAWTTIPGGVALPIVGGEGQIDDYQYFASADGSILTHYRVSSASLEDTVDVFTASGTWNKPPGLVAASVTVVGGGGAGGGVGATGGTQSAEGGGGAYGVIAVSVIPAADLGSSETVTVGSGGAGASGSDGGNGGTSSFTVTGGTSVSAGGGPGGRDSVGFTTSAAIGGGLGSDTGSGDIVIPGSDGSPGLVIDGTNEVCSAQNMGAGGPFGGWRRASTGSTDGSNGSLFGGGGSGARNLNSQTARPGGDGAPGLVVIEHFFAGEGP